jgi:predicted DNA-binding protein (MmcQ/YjbR family)
MNLDDLRAICIAKPGTTEERPFGPDTVVFKVMNKMFALCGDDPQPEFVNLKSDADDALFFREKFDGVKPGYHMDKRTWNSVYLVSDVPESLVREMIDDSYDLIVASLPKKVRSTLESQ